MSDMNFTIQSGESKRFLTGGKYNPNDIVVTAEGGGGSNGIELIETITLTEDTSSIVRKFMPDGTPYAFKSVIAMIGIVQEWSNKWVQSIAHYDNKLWAAVPYVHDHPTETQHGGFKSVNATSNNFGLHIGTIEVNGVILHLISYAMNPGYHNASETTIAPEIAYNTNNAKIIKFELKSEVPLVAETRIYLYGVRA